MVNRIAMTDCDEVFNYWEPLHFLLFGSSNSNSSFTTSAMQTWEYSHDYQLRTFAYLTPLQCVANYVLQPILGRLSPLWVSWIVQSLTNNHTTDLQQNERLALIVLMRAVVAATTALAECYWLTALPLLSIRETSNNIKDPRKLNHSMSPSLSMMIVLLLLTAPGMTHAAGALLPSATWMAVWCLCAGAALRQHHYFFAVTAIVATLGTGWPFGAVCVVPLAIQVLYQTSRRPGGLIALFVWMIGVTVCVQAIVSWIDYNYYGTMSFPTLNIFAYNAAGNGDSLYGVEPLSYYIKNLLLNLNAMAILGAAALPLYLLSVLLSWKRLDGRTLAMLLTIPAWFAVTLPRPHKEERFLFPSYPALIFSCAWTVDMIVCRFFDLFRNSTEDNNKENSPYRQSEHHVYKRIILGLVGMPIFLLSLSRTFALQRYYSAPLAIYGAIPPIKSPTQRRLVCVCGEWYRFPGSFYLESGVQLGFLRSSFRGQLPQPFSQYGSKAESRTVLQPFNDQNLEQPERYVLEPRLDCAYVVDLISTNDDTMKTCIDSFSSANVPARILKSSPFLDGDHTATLHRTLYLPYLHETAMREQRVMYQQYVLYHVEF